MKDETIQKIVADFRDKLEGANAAKDGGAVATAYVQPIAIWLTENLNQLLTHHDKEKAGEVVRRLEEEQCKNKEAKPNGYVEEVDERAYNAALVVALSIVKEVYQIEDKE